MFKEKYTANLIASFKSYTNGVVRERMVVTTPFWAKCEGEAHTPKSGKLESFETPERS
jgi:hypothetical protein